MSSIDSARIPVAHQPHTTSRLDWLKKMKVPSNMGQQIFNKQVGITCIT